jgi:hypothetical protein
VASVKVIVEPIHTPVGPDIGATTGAVFIVIVTFEVEDPQPGVEIVQVRI